MEAREVSTGKTSRLKTGDVVIVIAGGNKNKRPIKGKTGKIVRFVGDTRQRVIVEGLNMITRHTRPTTPNKPSGKIQREAAIHVSNVMYYVEKLKRGVRLRVKTLADGKKVRGYIDLKTKNFVQLEK
jgi:large subunit ribosomal protein L24